MLVLFVFALGALFAILALVIDVGNIWNNSLHVQQAAEAAALAGVPYMPGDFPTASTKAAAEAQRNGFSAAGGATVTPVVNLESNRRLDVTVSRSYGTYFLRLLGMNTVRISRTATAEYTLPVPMGSPLSTYGDNSGNFWAVSGSQGADRANGDAYGTFYNPNPTLNNQYDSRGYHYAIEVPPGAGATSIDLYDPTFCAVDAGKGTGDRWLPWNQTGWPVDVHLLHALVRPGRDAARLLGRRPGGLQRHPLRARAPGRQERRVPRGLRRRGRDSSFWSLPDCTADPYHNQWWTLTTVTTPGTYRLQVTTTDALNPNDQKGTSASNMWGLRAVRTDPAYKPYVYGLGKMVIYANVANGTTLFYLARDRGRPCRKDGGHPAVRPGRRVGQREHRGPQADLDRLRPGDIQLHRRQQRHRLEERHECHQSRDRPSAAPAVQQLLGHDHDPAPQDVRRAAPAGRARRHPRRLVEDPLHLQQHDDRHHHLADVDPGQPCPSRPAIGPAPGSRGSSRRASRSDRMIAPVLRADGADGARSRRFP